MRGGLETLLADGCHAAAGKSVFAIEEVEPLIHRVVHVAHAAVVDRQFLAGREFVQLVAHRNEIHEAVRALELQD